jgi:hypothetical protein
MAKNDKSNAGNVQLSDAEKKVARAKQRVDSFKKLAPARVNRALKALEAVASLANKKSYTYTDAESQKIRDAVAAAAKSVDTAFTSGAVTSGFTL